MAKIKIQTTTKKKDDEPEPDKGEGEAYDDAVEDGDFDDTSEWVKETTTARREREAQEAEELAKGVAKDVAAEVSKPEIKEAPLTRPTIKSADPDEDLNIDPGTNYPKIAMLRISVGDDDEQGMEEWLETVREALKDVTKNATVLTRHRLINGKQVANHRYEEELPDDS